MLVLLVLCFFWFSSESSNGPRRWFRKVKTKSKNAVAVYSDNKPPSTEHPIKLLHLEATEKFQKMIDRQSKTIEEAVAEYKRRYNRDPPEGFEKWFEFAQFKNSVIIDDFDMILESLEPWLKLPAATINRVFERAAYGPLLWTFGIHDGYVMTANENWMGIAMRELLKDVAQYLPDFELLMNPLDEPRVLLTRRGDTEIIHWTDESKVSSWDRVEAPCRYPRPPVPKQQRIESNVNTDGIPFVTNLFDANDVCQNPQFELQHGFLIAPFTLYTTSSPVPVLSQAKPSTFADILVPSMWYFEHHIPDLNMNDLAWSDKTNALYWAGSTTGGVWRDDMPEEEGERLSHRHRFIKTTKQLGRGAKHTFLTKQPRTGFWVKYESTQVMSELYDTKFTKVVQCEGQHCDSANETYRVSEPEHASTAFKYKFLMDMDGNSFSGRFYNFLQSGSCPLKQSIFREWHDERLVPWVHYVPISLGFEDLPEAMRYMATTAEGSAIAETIAKTGSDWHGKFLRRDDAAVYLFRLFLEFGRLVDPNRK